MGTFTRHFQEKADSIVTDSYVYAPTDLTHGEQVKRVKIVRSLWDTGASVSLISARVVKVLGLTSIGKTGVSGYNDGVDVKDTYLVHIDYFQFVLRIKSVTGCKSGFPFCCEQIIAICNKFT